MSQEDILKYLTDQYKTDPKKYHTTKEIHKAIFPENHIRGTTQKLRGLLRIALIELDLELVLKCIFKGNSIIYRYRIKRK